MSDTVGHVVEPVVEHAVQPSVEHVVQPSVEHAVEPSVEHAQTSSLVEMILADMMVEHVVEPLVEHVVEPSVEHVVAPLVELTQTPSMVEVTIADATVEISKLTDQQRDIVQSLYESAKAVSESSLADSTLDASLKITRLIAQLMAFMEQVNLGSEKISGANKKAVVLELGRLLIKDHIKDNIQRVKILLMYDVLAEKTLEVMIDVSHVVNKQAAKVATSFWDCLGALCGK